MSMRRMALLVTVLLTWSLSTSAAEPSVTPYFTTDELPDLTVCLPPPPDTTGEHFAHDVMRYFWGKEQRKDPQRAFMARRDAVWDYDSLFAGFSDAFGLRISRSETPEIYRLLVTSLTTTDQMRVAPKKRYMRKRPFVRFGEHLLTYGAEENEEGLAGEGSYPSGHTARGWTAALILAQVNPSRANEIFARGWDYGESRVIVGAHWQSDVDASRVGAAIGFSRLQTSEAFRRQMTKAQDEFRKKGGKTSASPVLSNCSNDFVSLTEAVPDAILEIRYYSTYNFVGRRIDGYLQPTALLTRRAADSLRAVSEELKEMGYRLKIYDAYRPQMAVNHFVRWAENIPDTMMKAYFYPDLDKSVLFERDYIAAKSGHTRGSTVDLTLFDMRTEKEVDMGGTFDWFGPESHPDFCGNPETGVYTGDNAKSPARRSITATQFANRMLLRRVMLRHGFKPYDSEWWHFTLRDEPYPDTYFTFPVRQLR